LNKKVALDAIYECFSKLNYNELQEVVKEALESKVKPTEIIAAMQKGLDEVGDKYEKGEYFLSELILAGAMATEALNALRPHLDERRSKTLGKGSNAFS
jgi:5-methyltetrahydrofolate--homocysteine methyltransferase